MKPSSSMRKGIESTLRHAALVAAMTASVNVHSATFPPTTPIPDLPNLCQYLGNTVIHQADVTIDPSTTLQRQSVFYTTGSSLDVKLVVPSCSTVDRVEVRGAEVPQLDGPVIDPPPVHYREMGRVVLPDNQAEITVRVSFANSGRGFSQPVEIFMRNEFLATDPGDSETFVFTGVKAVESFASALSISEDELNEGFNAAIFDVFGADGIFEDTIGSETIKMYAPTYRPVSVSSSGLRYRWQARVEIDNFCDLELHADSWFSLGVDSDVDDLDGDGDTAELTVTPTWLDGSGNPTDGPNVYVDLPIYCAATSPIYGGLIEKNFYWIVDMSEATIREQVAGFVTGEANSLVEAFGCEELGEDGCMSLIGEFEPKYNELRVGLDLPYAAKVQVDVPYGNQFDESPVGHGFAFNEGDEVAFVTSGRSQICGSFYYGLYPDCSNLSTAPNGSLNSAVVDAGEFPYPVPMAHRTPESLPMPDVAVGALVGLYEAEPPPVPTWPWNFPGGIVGFDWDALAAGIEPVALGNLGALTVSGNIGGHAWMYFVNNEIYNTGAQTYGAGTLETTVVFLAD